MTQTPALTKSELASLCKVTPKTIQDWCNKRYYESLKKLGYYKTQKVLLPKQVDFFIKQLDIDIKESV